MIAWAASIPASAPRAGWAAAGAVSSPTTRSADDGLYVVGHNSGRSVETTARMLAAGANVVEIDVRSLGGVLVSAHLPVPTVGSMTIFLGPTVEEVWAVSGGAEAVFLDLKESSDDFVALVAALLAAHRGEDVVLVASTETTVPDRLSEASPEAVLLRSVHDRQTLAETVAAASTCGTIDGVTIREDLLDRAAIDRLRAEGLLIFAWTVNDRARAEALVRLGVDGIITDSAAILGDLGDSRPGNGAHRAHGLGGAAGSVDLCT